MTDCINLVTFIYTNVGTMMRAKGKLSIVFFNSELFVSFAVTNVVDVCTLVYSNVGPMATLNTYFLSVLKSTSCHIQPYDHYDKLDVTVHESPTQYEKVGNIATIVYPLLISDSTLVFKVMQATWCPPTAAIKNSDFLKSNLNQRSINIRQHSVFPTHISYR